MARHHQLAASPATWITNSTNPPIYGKSLSGVMWSGNTSQAVYASAASLLPK